MKALASMSNNQIMDLDLITDPNIYLFILMGQFVLYAVFTLYLERRSTHLKESSWRSIFNFRSNAQGFSNLHEGFS